METAVKLMDECCASIRNQRAFFNRSASKLLHWFLLLKLCQFLHETLQRYSLVLLGNCQRLTKRRCELTQRLYLWCLRRDKTMSTLENLRRVEMIDANQLKRIILRRPPRGKWLYKRFRCCVYSPVPACCSAPLLESEAA